MKDDFLYNHRPLLRKAFADSLYQRLSKIEPNNHIQRKGAYEMVKSVMTEHKWKLALSVFIIVAILSFAISEPVRAKAIELIRIVAGFTVEEHNESPIKELSPNEDKPTQAANEIAIVPTVSTPDIKPTVFPVETLELSAVLANPPFTFALPTWIPEGYKLDKTVGISSSNNWVSLIWNQSDLGEIEMLVEREYNGYPIPTGKNGAEEITINGKPALLVRGFWNAQHEWDLRLGLALDWEKDGHHYHLNYTERGSAHHEIIPMEGDTELILKELIKMAESVP